MLFGEDRPTRRFADGAPRSQHAKRKAFQRTGLARKSTHAASIVQVVAQPAARSCPSLANVAIVRSLPVSLTKPAANVLARFAQGNLRSALANRYRASRGRRRQLHRKPVPNRYLASSRRLNALIDALGNDQRYLELGVDHGYTFETIRAPWRHGVDPCPQFNTDLLPTGMTFSQLTSDDFFRSIAESDAFDLVFVDGLHQYEQAYRDVINSFAHLTKGGIVVLDDVVPRDAISALPDLEVVKRLRADSGTSEDAWQGDTFLVLLILADHHPEIEFRTIVGSGNEQAVMWLVTDRPPSPLDSTTLARYRAVDFETVFSDGIPAKFNTGVEQHVLGDAVTELHRSRLSTDGSVNRPRDYFD